VLLFSCKTAEVHVEFNPSIDFNKYHSYKWLKNDQIKPYQSLQDQHLIKSIEGELAEKGLSSVTGRSDLLLKLEQTSKEKQVLHRSFSSFHPAYHSYYWGNSYDYDVDVITEKTLLLVIIDAESRNSLWEGSISDWRYESKSQEELNKLIKALLERFPPQ